MPPAAPTGLELRAFSADTEADPVALVNAYTAGWPYTRRIDAELVAHWRTLGERYQPERLLLAYREGTPRAFLHGERAGDVHYVHLLAVAPEAVEEGVSLLAHAEAQARAEGAARLCGPTCDSGRWYGGYILGLEPYHPHWAVAATQALVRAGYHMTQCDVLMVAEAPAEAVEGLPPAGYEIAGAACAPEFKARVFRLVAQRDGQEVATCGGRLYPELIGSSGRPIGQLGFVGTEAAHRGRGLATALVRRALARLWEWGAGEVLISTGLENGPALRAYERAGFRRRHNQNEWQKLLTQE